MKSMRTIAAIAAVTLVSSLVSAGVASAAPAPTVTRISGPNRYATAAAVSAQFEAGPDYAFIATGTNFPDALAGAALAGSSESPLLLVQPDAVSSRTASELERLQPKEIVILGGNEAVSPGVEEQLQGYSATGNVIRVSGKDRYATADAISATYEPGVDYAFVATGENFPDALSAAAYAGMLDAPLLITRSTGLSQGTISELTRLQPEKIVIIGGTNAVSSATEAQLGQYATADGTGSVIRIGGKDRYSTSALIAETFTSSSAVYVATGDNFPDALAGAAHAGATHSSLVLTRQQSIPSAVLTQIVRLAPKNLYLLGGTAAISNGVVSQLTTKNTAPDQSTAPAKKKPVVTWNGEGARIAPSTKNSTTMYDNGYEFELVKMLAGDNNRSRFPEITKGIGMPNPDGSTPYSLKSSIAPNGYGARSEVINTYDADMYKQVAFGYNMLVPTTQKAPTGNQWSIFSQLKQTNCGVPPVAFHWSKDGVQSAQYFEYEIRLQNDVTGWQPTPNYRVIYRGTMPKGQWNRLAMVFVSSPNNPNNTYFEYWVNGKKQSIDIPAGEAIGYTSACTQYPVPMSMNLRTGIYRGGAKWVEEGVTYYDNMKFGTTYSDVAK